MDDFFSSAGAAPAPDVLHGSLRHAVEHILAQPIPAEAQRRALRRLEKPERPIVPFQRGAWQRIGLVVASIAATVLIALFMQRSGQNRAGSQRLAMNRQDSRLAQLDNEQAPSDDVRAKLKRALQIEDATGAMSGQRDLQEVQTYPKKDSILKAPAAMPEPSVTRDLSRGSALQTAELKQKQAAFGERYADPAHATPPVPAMRQPQRFMGAYRPTAPAPGGVGGKGSAAPSTNASGQAGMPGNDPAQRGYAFSPMTGRAASNAGSGGGAGRGGFGSGINGGFGGRQAGQGMMGRGATAPTGPAGNGSFGPATPPFGGFQNAPADRVASGQASDQPRDGRREVRDETLTRGRQVLRAADKDVKARVEQLQLGEAAGLKPALRSASGGGRAGGADKAKKKEDKTARKAAVFRRHAGRPTFGRVYIGDGNSLDLLSVHVTTTIEGPRARTVVDHIFYNPHDRQLEGTFEYPLPSGASPSYFAMAMSNNRAMPPPVLRSKSGVPDLPAAATQFGMAKSVHSADWGQLHEAHVVGRARALDIYEQVIRQRIDPGLMEYDSGNTFRGRVFPIPAHSYNRVILAYEELLPDIDNTVVYRYPLPGGQLQNLQYTLDVSAADNRQSELTLKKARREEGGGRVRYTQTWTGEAPGGSVGYAFIPANPQVQVISGRQNESGPLYVYARVRPNLPVQDAVPYSDRAVFLLDTSYSERTDGFARNMKLMQAILEKNADIRQFNVLAFNIGATWLDPKGWFDNTPAGREKAFARLDAIVLEGATDLSVALDRLAHPAFKQAVGTPLDVFLLSDGNITWGESDINTLVARFERTCPYRVRFTCYRTGLGADNLTLFQALTRKGGGVFNCFSDDFSKAAVAYREQCLQVDKVRILGLSGVRDLMVAGRQAAVFPDGDLIVTARAGQPGRGTLVVEGAFLGKKFAEEYPIEVKGADDLAPRGWGEVAVASLLALNDPAYDDLVTAYCQEFGIGSQVASFLVLENENDYKRLNLEAERGKIMHDGDLGRFLDNTWQSQGREIAPHEAFARFINQVSPRVHLFDGPNSDHVKTLIHTLARRDYELPPCEPINALVYRKDVPPAYLQAREAAGDNCDAFIAEANRRVDQHDVGGAVRCLSTIIEEFPGRSDGLRLVGYRLMDLKQPVQAAHLFQRVERQRPFEPHSYLDLARSLEACGRFGLASIQYEIVLAGTWDARFHQSLKTIALEEYLLMMRQALRKKQVTGKLADVFGERLEKMAKVKTAADLRVTISWNTDNTDVDLWVIEPDGTKCFYQNRKTRLGGELSEDQTQGFGPERYQMVKAAPGVYTVYVHYFRPNPNLLAGESHVTVVITRHADTPQETVERHSVILKKGNEAVEVAKIKF